MDVRLHRDSAFVGRAQPVLHSRRGIGRGPVPAVCDIPGQDAGGPDRAAKVEVGQLKYCRLCGGGASVASF